MRSHRLRLSPKIVKEGTSSMRNTVLNDTKGNNGYLLEHPGRNLHECTTGSYSAHNPVCGPDICEAFHKEIEITHGGYTVNRSLHECVVCNVIEIRCQKSTGVHRDRQNENQSKHRSVRVTELGSSGDNSEICHREAEPLLTRASILLMAHSTNP